MSLRSPLALVVAVVALIAATAQPSGARTTGSDVTIDFEVGDFDSTQGDWPITAVNVSGDLTTGRSFTVELRNGDGDVLWSGTGTYSLPHTTIEVTRFVAVGDVEEAALAQRQAGTPSPAPPTDPVDPIDPVDPADPVDPVDPTDPTAPTEPIDPADPAGPSVADNGTTNPGQQAAAGPGGGTDPTTPGVVDDPTKPADEVEGDVVTRPERMKQQASGVGGAGQLALSMVIAVVFVAILFRTPLPSATTQRWRK